MPLEIREIGIRMEVTSDARPAAPIARVPLGPRADQPEPDRARLIEECTQAVLKALDRASER